MCNLCKSDGVNDVIEGKFVIYKEVGKEDDLRTFSYTVKETYRLLDRIKVSICENCISKEVEPEKKSNKKYFRNFLIATICFLVIALLGWLFGYRGITYLCLIPVVICGFFSLGFYFASSRSDAEDKCLLSAAQKKYARLYGSYSDKIHLMTEESWNKM